MQLKLKQIFLFENLDDKVIDEISKFTYYKKLQKDNIVFYEGDKSEYIYLLHSGIVKLYKTSSHDKEVILKYFHQNELIAEVANFEHIPYPATAKAFTDIEVLKINFEKFKSYIYSNPDLAFTIQSSLIKKIKNLENLISTHLILDSHERVAQYIYYHTDDFFKTKNIEIASILNITPETLSRILRIFKKDNLIDLKTKTIDKENLKNKFI
jgi:CRP/FNR family transcriptional regulator